MSKDYLTVRIKREVLEGLLEFSRRAHPRENIFLLRGKRRKGEVVIEEALIPPLAEYGETFTAIPLHMLPVDFSIIGTYHSHPSGIPVPSPEDLNNFFGIVMLIAAYPYDSEYCVVAYNRKGVKLPLVVED
ncbi:MAG: Mov34/MPN/PAD-1 family protein [Candidatus Verstraetearchaeota archaeon]|nr:Mov34/MPN/PAD-1 family protein [Candidatus Verstraetearchaeota archaeon]